MDIEIILLEVEEKMDLIINSYKSNLSKINVGRANPQLLESLKVEYYGELTPINNIASITSPEGRQLLIKPFDQTLVKNIVSVINSSSLGLSCNDEGTQIRINIPQMTTERRKELVKQFGKFTEQSKIQIRSERQAANKTIKSIKDLPEDDSKSYLEKVQTLTDKFINKIDELSKEKEIDLTTI